TLGAQPSGASSPSSAPLPLWLRPFVVFFRAPSDPQRTIQYPRGNECFSRLIGRTRVATRRGAKIEEVIGPRASIERLRAPTADGRRSELLVDHSEDARIGRGARELHRRVAAETRRLADGGLADEALNVLPRDAAASEDDFREAVESVAVGHARELD